MELSPSNAEAIQKFSQAVEMLRAKNDLARLHLALGSLGKEYMRSGAVLKALTCFEEAIAIAQQAGDVESEALHTGNQGSALAEIGNFDMALRSLRKAQSLGRRANQPATVYDTLVAMASIEISRENADQAVDYLREAQENAQEAGDAGRELNATMGLAQAIWESGEVTGAIEQYSAALELAIQAGNLEVEMEAFDRLAVLYHQAEAYSEENNTLRRAIQRADENSGIATPPLWLLRLGEACVQLEDWDCAEQSFRRALAAGIDQANLGVVTRAFGGLSVTCGEQGRLPEAYDYAQKAVQAAEQDGQRDLVAEQLVLLAFAQRDLGQAAQAADTARRGLEIFIQTENFSAEQRVRRFLEDLSAP